MELTVAKAIEILKTMDPDAVFIKSSDNYELNNALVKAVSLQEVDMFTVEKTFRDDFDGDLYKRQVYDYNSSDTNAKPVKCVRIY